MRRWGTRPWSVLGHPKYDLRGQGDQGVEAVRNAPATGPGSTLISPSNGRAIGGVIDLASRRMRRASPPAHAGSVSARWCGSASALTGSARPFGSPGNRIVDAEQTTRRVGHQIAQAVGCHASDDPAIQRDLPRVHRAPAARRRSASMPSRYPLHGSVHSACRVPEIARPYAANRSRYVVVSGPEMS